MNLSQIKAILAASGLRLTKSLGQNFLHDANQLRRIIGRAQLNKDDKVLEIGPGLGALTELLVERADEVLAIEKDARLVRLLQERFKPQETPDGGRGPTGAFQLIHDDALEYLQREPRNWSLWKVVANLPYSVASPILIDLAQGPGAPERIVVTLQLEVARRLMASPGNADYGVLTLLLQLRYEPAGWFKIPSACFFPEPEVDSACVCLQQRHKALLAPEQRGVYVRIVKRSFSQRRKMMLKLLKQDWPVPALLGAFERLGLRPDARAETISLPQFVRLAEWLAADSTRE